MKYKDPNSLFLYPQKVRPFLGEFLDPPWSMCCNIHIYSIYIYYIKVFKLTKHMKYFEHSKSLHARLTISSVYDNNNVYYDIRII